MANFRMHFDINNYSLKKILEKYSYATYYNVIKVNYSQKSYMWVFLGIT